jgi:hypothetical protein
VIKKMAKFKFDGDVEVNGNIKSKSSNTVIEKKEENYNQWEFFKKVDGLLTDQIQKMVNIPSTLFTPAFSLPSKLMFSNVAKVIAIIKGVIHKFKKIDEALHQNRNESSKRKKMVKLSILNSFEKNKWIVNYYKKENKGD